MELTIQEKCALIANSRHIQEVEIRETEGLFRVRWRNDPTVQLQSRSPDPIGFNILLNDALSYIAYLDIHQMSY